MLKLTNGSLCRPTIGVLGAALAMACAVPAMAEPGSTTAPAAQNSGQTMGAMKQQMMQQMQTCMNQMPPMSGTDPTAMRHQMMESMHGCMEQMMAPGGAHHCGAMKQGSGTEQSEEPKPDAHDHSGKDAEPGH